MNAACTAKAVPEAHGVEGVADAAAELRQAVAGGARRRERGAGIYVAVGMGEGAAGIGEGGARRVRRQAEAHDLRLGETGVQAESSAEA